RRDLAPGPRVGGGAGHPVRLLVLGRAGGRDAHGARVAGGVDAGCGGLGGTSSRGVRLRPRCLGPPRHGHSPRARTRLKAPMLGRSVVRPSLPGGAPCPTTTPACDRSPLAPPMPTSTIYATAWPPRAFPRWRRSTAPHRTGAAGIKAYRWPTSSMSSTTGIPATTGGL